MHHREHSASFEYHYRPAFSEDHIICDWSALRTQLLSQWPRLEPKDIDKAGQSRHALAELVGHTYDIASPWVENYLRNFERTMPL